MSLTNNNDMVMPVAPMYGNGGNGFGWGGDGGAFWLLVLFLFAFNGGWGNGFGGNGMMPFAVNNDVQRGFDQSAIMNGITGLTSAVANGFANAEISRANTNTNTLQSIWGVQSALQNCCCENRAGLADLKYTVATENCADRQVVSDGIRDVIASNLEQTNAILSKLSQLELDAKNDKIADLERQLTMANLSASQIAQTAEIQKGQIAEIDAMYQRLKDCPVPTMPVYGMTPIFSCNNGGCGCGGTF